MTNTLADLMNEIGPLDDAIDSVTVLGDARWIVRFPELDVEIEADEATGRVMLSTVLAPAPADRRGDVYETLLLYNLAWRETGGVRMALNGADGPVVQIADVPMQDLSARLLVTVARNLVRRGAIWTQFLLGRVPPAAPARPSPPDPSEIAHFLRL
ncbi:type III secretion system chaperone [Aureimonas jatrophae]|uniref:Tir chaperone protein (CesT) family protein n=1 Tax=Aureimonas jatrophae TaxID=1166073 RepID=A0A1H0EU66_9HYPH|nr:type III secretion system chaperone [Aureimonas jatrophae]MBB3950311.1 hypothetical protein [Aureimonas jatrophae]SDN85944.1 Tir chaperone protein (CesT) family protein [Aureimonas jatrophae]